MLPKYTPSWPWSAPTSGSPLSLSRPGYLVRQASSFVRFSKLVEPSPSSFSPGDATTTIQPCSGSLKQRSDLLLQQRDYNSLWSSLALLHPERRQLRVLAPGGELAFRGF